MELRKAIKIKWDLWKEISIYKQFYLEHGQVQPPNNATSLHGVFWCVCDFFYRIIGRKSFRRVLASTICCGHSLRNLDIRDVRLCSSWWPLKPMLSYIIP